MHIHYHTFPNRQHGERKIHTPVHRQVIQWRVHTSRPAGIICVKSRAQNDRNAFFFGNGFYKMRAVGEGGGRGVWCQGVRSNL